MKINLAKSLILVSSLGLLILLSKIFIFSYIIDNSVPLSKLYELFQNLILSFVAATIFYFIVQYFPHQERKIKLLHKLDEFKKNCGIV